MLNRWRQDEIEEREQPASPAFSRLLVVGYLIAGLLGLLMGLIWVAWNLFTRHPAG